MRHWYYSPLWSDAVFTDIEKCTLYAESAHNLASITCAQVVVTKAVFIISADNSLYVQR
ncbi:MAG: hypothetical protein QOC61_1283 [Acidobacteriota bacterium]|jgi:hypothetical protein|nr:hypothetical protein [Acidobacteriota bacterium]